MRLQTIALTAGAALLLLMTTGCSKNSTPNSSTTSPQDTAFAYGSDISWVTQMEEWGVKFYDAGGAPQDLYTIMKGLGINAIRLRAWVNPDSGWCNTADVVAKALRAKAAGMKVLIDFHYSDTWADPGHQTPPAAWAGLGFSAMESALGTYTEGVLDTLKQNGVTPTWVQIGNEVDNGILWPTGEASTSMGQFAALVSTGYSAVKSVFPDCKVIVHVSNGYDNSTFRWLFDGIKSYGATWDVIGMSLYPTAQNWQQYDSLCLANMKDMQSRYGSEVMVCEVGFAENDPTNAEAFLKDIIAKAKSVGGLGVFYWEPEAYDWMNYGLGAFGLNGEPTAAMSAF